MCQMRQVHTMTLAGSFIWPRQRALKITPMRLHFGIALSKLARYMIPLKV